MHMYKLISVFEIKAFEMFVGDWLKSMVKVASNQALLICVGGIKSLVHTVCACAENSRGLDGCDKIIIIKK